MVGAAVAEGDGETLSLRFPEADTDEQPLTVFDRGGEGVRELLPE